MIHPSRDEILAEQVQYKHLMPKRGSSDRQFYVGGRIQVSFVMLTKDYEDFLELHDVVQAAQGLNPSIHAIRSDNDNSNCWKHILVWTARFFFAWRR